MNTSALMISQRSKAILMELGMLLSFGGLMNIILILSRSTELWENAISHKRAGFHSHIYEQVFFFKLSMATGTTKECNVIPV